MPNEKFSFDELVQQEKEVVFSKFGIDEAYSVGMKIVERAKRENKVIAVSITIARQNIFHYAFDGLAPDSDNWIRRKSNVVYQFHKSSLLVGETLEKKGNSLVTHGLNPNDFMTNGGSFPIRVKGAGVIGAITVTGLPHLEDHDYVVVAMRGEKDK